MGGAKRTCAEKQWQPGQLAPLVSNQSPTKICVRKYCLVQSKEKLVQIFQRKELQPVPLRTRGLPGWVGIFPLTGTRRKVTFSSTSPGLWAQLLAEHPRQKPMGEEELIIGFYFRSELHKPQAAYPPSDSQLPGWSSHPGPHQLCDLTDLIISSCPFSL